jgi:hypothetical protein
MFSWQVDHPAGRDHLVSDSTKSFSHGGIVRPTGEDKRRHVGVAEGTNDGFANAGTLHGCLSTTYTGQLYSCTVHMGKIGVKLAL